MKPKVCKQFGRVLVASPRSTLCSWIQKLYFLHHFQEFFVTFTILYIVGSYQCIVSIQKKTSLENFYLDFRSFLCSEPSYICIMIWRRKTILQRHFRFYGGSTLLQCFWVIRLVEKFCGRLKNKIKHLHPLSVTKVQDIVPLLHCTALMFAEAWEVLLAPIISLRNDLPAPLCCTLLMKDICNYSKKELVWNKAQEIWGKGTSGWPSFHLGCSCGRV